MADQMHGSGGRADMNGFVSRFLVDHPGIGPEEIASACRSSAGRQNPDRRVTFDHTSILATVGDHDGGLGRLRPRTRHEEPRGRGDPRFAARRPSARIPFDAHAYADDRVIDRAARLDEGVSGELRSAFLTAHGEATPEETAAHFRRIVTA